MQKIRSCFAPKHSGMCKPDLDLLPNKRWTIKPGIVLPQNNWRNLKQLFSSYQSTVGNEKQVSTCHKTIG